MHHYEKEKRKHMYFGDNLEEIKRHPVKRSVEESDPEKLALIHALIANERANHHLTPFIESIQKHYLEGNPGIERFFTAHSSQEQVKRAIVWETVGGKYFRISFSFDEAAKFLIIEAGAPANEEWDKPRYKKKIDLHQRPLLSWNDELEKEIQKILKEGLAEDLPWKSK